MTNLFGTDGIRADVRHPLLEPENFTKLGRIIASVIHDYWPESNLSVTIGRDTRSSGCYLEAALAAGLISSGINCECLGIIPSPGLAYCTKISTSSLGIIISASHNPASDNGIKIFMSNGFKINTEIQKTIEYRFNNGIQHPISLNPGQLYHNHGAIGDYAHFLKQVATSPKNIRKLVIDCAHGAASVLAPKFFTALGYNVEVIGASPNGANINRHVGSEAPEMLKTTVLKHQADLGIAFDGDADRVIFVDEKGQLIDGDATLALFAINLKKHGLLEKDTLVCTVMSSIAISNILDQHQIKTIRTDVGDRWVAEAMHLGGFSLGGENSGHFVMAPNNTGDGLLAAINFINIANESNLKVSELLSFYQPTPRVLKNFTVNHKYPLSELPLTDAAITFAQNELGSSGRILFRFSGTENKARLLVEAPTEKICQLISEQIGLIFTREINSKTV